MVTIEIAEVNFLGPRGPLRVIPSVRPQSFYFSHLQRVPPRVVRGDINFGILRDPLNFLFLIDLYGPYLIEFLIKNGSFLLTKAHVFEANWTERPSTLEAFLGHFPL